jgi:hypothetical protein
MTLKRSTRMLLRLPRWVQRLGEHVAARMVPDDLPELSAPRAAAERARVALIVVWLGPVPSYMPAFLRSCATNPDFDWLIFADWDRDALELPSNVRLFHASRARIVARCFRTLGLVPPLADPNKLCDLRPQFWSMFAHELAGYTYWGFCDLDCVWGDLNAAYGAPIRDGVDVVTSRKEVLAGHFTAIRAGSPIEAIAREDVQLRADMLNPEHVWVDEERFSELVREAARAGTIRVHWPDCLAGDGDIVGPDRLGPEPWSWRDGRITFDGREFSYLHFMHWKHRPEFRCTLDSRAGGAFTITAAGIRSDTLDR